MSHKQPSLEKHLREAIDKDFGEVRSQCLVTDIEEDANFVYVKYQAPDGDSQRLRGKFMVGADGKTGFTRKKYLEPRGVVMERSPKLVFMKSEDSIC
jgi:2-polyprenyl-6-methoxyphenol hydroxylase-like FAD-dependent oxidoreductase